MRVVSVYECVSVRVCLSECESMCVSSVNVCECVNVCESSVSVNACECVWE